MHLHAHGRLRFHSGKGHHCSNCPASRSIGTEVVGTEVLTLSEDVSSSHSVERTHTHLVRIPRQNQ
eukprot:2928143-Prorocentrum_lima.AAC.1